MKKKKNISQEDINTWNNFTKNPTGIVNKDNIENRKESHRRFRYDLHGFTLSNANEKVKELILSCAEKNYKEILLITGKGIHSNTSDNTYASNELSKLRFSVPDYIKSNPDLSNFIHSISSASKSDGGDGAIIITLKKIIK